MEERKRSEAKADRHEPGYHQPTHENRLLVVADNAIRIVDLDHLGI